MSTGLNQLLPEPSGSMAKSYANWPYVINLSNSIVGVSILALPFCFKECGVILGLLLLLGCAWLTKMTCHLLMKTAFMTKKRTYEYLAFHVFGPTGKLVVEISIIGILIGQCIAFYIIIGDLGPAIIAKMTGVENTPMLRCVVMTLLAMFVALPLGMLNSLERLSSYSAASLTFYCIFVIQVIFAAFPNLWSGVWLSKVIFWNPDGIFKSLPIFALSFSCHTQLFIIYDALPEASVGRMRCITKRAVIFCSFVYCAVGFFGYVAFCDEEISGDILMSFRPTLFNDFVKLGFVMSTVVSFPLVIYPCRASIYTLLFAKTEKTSHNNISGTVYIPTLHFKLITLSIITFTLIVGILVPNVEFVLAITGATMGSLICYVLPAGLFITVMTFGKSDGKVAAQVVLFIGMSILLASTYVTLNSQERVERHGSVVRVGQPIVHLEENGAVAPVLEEKMKTPEVGSRVGSVVNTHKMPGRLKNENLQVNQDYVSVKILPATNQTQVSERPKVPLKDDLDIDVEIRKEPPNPRAPAEDLLPNVPPQEAIIDSNIQHHPLVENQGLHNMKRNEAETIVNNSEPLGLLRVQLPDGQVLKNDGVAEVVPNELPSLIRGEVSGPNGDHMRLINQSRAVNVQQVPPDVLGVRPPEVENNKQPKDAPTLLGVPDRFVGQPQQHNLQAQKEPQQEQQEKSQQDHRQQQEQIQNQSIVLPQVLQLQQNVKPIQHLNIQQDPPSLEHAQRQSGVQKQIAQQPQKLSPNLRQQQLNMSLQQQQLNQQPVQHRVEQKLQQKELQLNPVVQQQNRQQQQHPELLPHKPVQPESILDDAPRHQESEVKQNIRFANNPEDSNVVVENGVRVEKSDKKRLDNEAQDILVVLKKQQQEQRELLDVQRKLIHELKRHNKDAHGNGEV